MRARFVSAAFKSNNDGLDFRLARSSPQTVQKLAFPNMRTTASLAAFLATLKLAAAHGDHGKDESGKDIAEGDYALRHVRFSC